MQVLRRYRALAPERRRAAASALIVVTAVRIGLTVLSFGRLRTIVRRLASRTEVSRSGYSSSPDELLWAVGVASRYVPRATCLVQALALELLLARSGHPAELRIGIAKENGDLKAHAWVESGGQRLLEDAEPARFAALSGGW